MATWNSARTECSASRAASRDLAPTTAATSDLSTRIKGEAPVGLLSSLFKILHPVRTAKRRKRAVMPRPIRKAKWIAGGVVNPVDRAEYLARRAVIRKADEAISPKPKRRR